MAWRVVAEGRNFADLRARVANMEFGKGTRLRMVMEGPPGFGPACDITPNWLVPAPEGTEVIDVWGEGAGTGIIELEADPVWLVAVLTFVKVHWVALLIGGAVGFVLGMVLTKLELLANIPGAIVGAGIIVLVLVALAVLSRFQAKGGSP